MNIKVGNKNLRLLSYNTDDKLYSNCIFFYWACSIANAVIKRALGGSMRATLVSAAICFPVFLAFAVKAVLVLYRQKRIKTLLIPAFFFCCAFIISAFRGVPVSVMPIMIMWGILGIFLGSVLVSIEDYSVLYYEFHRGITLLIIISLIGLLVANRSYYMMHFSYLLVLPCCVSFYSFWEKRQFKNIISVLIFLAIIIGAGARGAIAVFAVFVASYILLKSRNTMARISFTFVGAICFFAYDIILSVAYKLLSGLGIESRTLWLLINDPLHSSGRDILASQARQVIDMKPLFGWGVAGERIIMDNYPHSIILEFLIDYGKPLGLFLLIILGLIVFICFLRVKGIVAFFYTAFVAGVTGLFWSGSYLSDPGFWILLFFSIRIIKTHNFRPYWVQKVGDDARKVKNGTNYDGRFSYFY